MGSDFSVLLINQSYYCISSHLHFNESNAIQEQVFFFHVLFKLIIAPNFFTGSQSLYRLAIPT